MKKFRILGIISITIIIIHTIGSFSDFTKGVSEGWNDAERVTADSIYKTTNNVTWGRISVKPLDGNNWEKTSSSLLGEKTPYRINSITTYVVPSRWYWIIETLIFPIAIAFFYGFYCLINFLISVAKRQIFTDKNVHRIHWFSYSYIVLQLHLITIHWLGEQAALAQINLPGYELISDTLIEADWISMILIIHFTENFAIGTKIKEEQDLTI